MLSRALSLATVTLLLSCLAAIPVRAQNLEAGKSPSQIFSGTCTACHKGARGLLKTVAPGSLPGFLRQHYTTSSEMASQLSAFLIANGATAPDPRGAKPTQQAKDARPAAPEQLDRHGRPIRPAPAPEAARPEGEPQQAAIPPGPDGRKSAAKQKLSKRGKPEEPPKTDTAKPDAAKDESAKTEAAKEDTAKSETAKEAAKDTAKDDAAKPHGEANPQSAHIAAPKANSETPALRSDPVPPVTPAPAMSADGSDVPLETAATPAPPPLTMMPVPPAATDSGPPLPPVAPAGPPVPPISQ